MSDFTTLLNEYTQKGDAKVHGVLARCVDKNGSMIYDKIVGHHSLDPDAAPVDDLTVFKFASATKLITSIALLQCIERSLIGLDEPVERIVPELGKYIITGTSTSGDLIIEQTKGKITPRHLLTHTSGLGYWFLDPRLIAWKKTSDGVKLNESQHVHEKFNVPLVFEPGQGWSYGVNLDWAGVIVRRLHGDISLEHYMIEHIWKVVGLTAPFPTFDINHSSNAEYRSHLMQGYERAKDGSLKPYHFWQGDNPVDQPGGHGLSGRARDWLAVTTDLISDSPKLLKPATVAMMFEPQIAEDSPAMPMLLAMRPAWEIVAGPAPHSAINHGLGGVLVTEAVPELRQPANILAWGGAANTVWFISKDLGVSGFFSTQLHPFSDPVAKQLVNAWKRDFWTAFEEGTLPIL